MREWDYLTFTQRFLHLSRLGEGGQSQTFQAFDSQRHAHVLLKVGPDLSREKALLEQLSHKSIPQVLEYWQVPAHPFFAADSEPGRRAQPRLRALWEEPNMVSMLVLGFQPGITLQEYALGRRLPVPEVVRLALALCDVLSYIHSRGVVHRDIKPGNILVTGRMVEDRAPMIPDGPRRRAAITDYPDLVRTDIRHRTSARPPQSGPQREERRPRRRFCPGRTISLIDLGIAVPVGEWIDGENLMGTPGFLAPEAYLPHQVSATLDLFSLGATMYFLLEGEPPDIIWVNGRPRSVYRWLWGPLGTLVMNLLQTDPLHRPDLEATRRQLRRIAGEVAQRKSQYGWWGAIVSRFF